jgi:hypothetical protein
MCKLKYEPRITDSSPGPDHHGKAAPDWFNKGNPQNGALHENAKKVSVFNHKRLGTLQKKPVNT